MGGFGWGLFPGGTEGEVVVGWGKGLGFAGKGERGKGFTYGEIATPTALQDGLRGKIHRPRSWR